MFDVKDILGLLALCAGLIVASNMSLVSQKPKSLVKIAEKKSNSKAPSFSILDESLVDEVSIEGVDLSPPAKNSFEDFPRRSQKLSLFEY